MTVGGSKVVQGTSAKLVREKIRYESGDDTTLAVVLSTQDHVTKSVKFKEV